jgi:2-polyprenyl-3-methyl-5-hydroxy-6-metoxy-1,4-benzoquinol methylase
MKAMTHYSQGDARRLRILVAIASYGNKNVKFLEQITETYRHMPFEVDVVVVSEAPKHLGADVEVVVGLPSKNPWTLPFAHKPIFASRIDRYDLFIYSEDDIGVSERHVEAFLDVTAHLEADEIAGFVRYEVAPSGRVFVNEPWAHYHWKADSVRQRGPFTIAEFTNEHAGFYILTQDQLRRAIASGGFLRGPRQGRYQWPETAATDPYTICGFRKVICVSDIEKFLVHHLPNPYVSRLDVSLESFKEQIATLMNIRDGIHPATTLCNVESVVWPSSWNKEYYEKPDHDLLGLVPREAKTILSIGCGWGETEARLQERGATVTALPLDSVIGAVAERRGIGVSYGTWDECIRTLEGRTFDCVLMTNLLHLNERPGNAIGQCSRWVGAGGVLVLGGPNFDRVPWLLKRVLNVADYGRLRRFELGGHSLCVPRTLATPIRQAGLQVTEVRWLNHRLERGWLRGREMPMGGLTARNWVLQARRQQPRNGH